MTTVLLVVLALGIGVAIGLWFGSPVIVEVDGDEGTAPPPEYPHEQISKEDYDAQQPPKNWTSR